MAEPFRFLATWGGTFLSRSAWTNSRRSIAFVGAERDAPGTAQVVDQLDRRIHFGDAIGRRYLFFGNQPMAAVYDRKLPVVDPTR